MKRKELETVTIPKEKYDALAADVARLTRQVEYLLEQVGLAGVASLERPAKKVSTTSIR